MLKLPRWTHGILLTLLISAPALAQVDPGIQGTGPTGRARQILNDAGQIRDDSRKTQPPPSNTLSPAKGTQPAKSTNATGKSNTSAPKGLSQIDREALQCAKMGLDEAYRRQIWDGANAMARDETGATALHLAASKGHLKIVEFLATYKGSRIDARDNEGNTALALAAKAGRDDVLLVLLKAGADPKVKAADGATALHRAAAGGLAPSVTALLQGGADPTVKDGKGMTPLMLAEKEKKGKWEETAQLLREAEQAPRP